MTSEILCPGCNQSVNPQARYCQHCGVDLAIAAALLERDLTSPADKPLQKTPISPESLVPRLGEYLVSTGALKPEDLDRALEYQKACSRKEAPVLLGQALRQLELIDRETLDKAVTEQILQLQNALKEGNRLLADHVQKRTAELQFALKRVSELSQLKSNFISNISHELRTPLTHIKGYLELLRDGDLGPMQSQQTQAVETIFRSAERLGQLIEDLLHFSLAVRGSLRLKLEPTDMGKLVQRVTQGFRSRAEAKEVDLQVTVRDEMPNVRVDGEKIEWVITQLLDNAIKFTNTGGKVEATVEGASDLVTVTVADTGIGIPDEKMTEIFHPFHQLDGSHTRTHGGTGLGLALVCRIIDAHDSKIKVESEVGRGSSFQFCLPV